ncbi:MAG: YciI family protein [Dehalococcoidia bacterium]
MPEFVMFIAEDKELRAKLSDEAFATSFKKLSAWFKKHARAGSIVTSGGPRIERSNARTVRVDSGTVTITDGPFAETKELIGGDALLDVPTWMLRSNSRSRGRACLSRSSCVP